MEEGNLEADSFHRPCLITWQEITKLYEVCYFTMPLEGGQLTLFCIL